MDSMKKSTSYSWNRAKTVLKLSKKPIEKGVSKTKEAGNKVIDRVKQNSFKIYDNRKEHVHKILSKDFKTSEKADIAVGYFSVEGWEKISSPINQYKVNEGSQCRLLLGMYGKDIKGKWWENKTIEKLVKKNIFQSPNDEERKIGKDTFNKEKAFENLISQLADKKVVIKAVTSDQLHAKVYLFYKKSTDKQPTSGLMGSSNLSKYGLEINQELNLHFRKKSILKEFSKWFNEIWDDKKSFDISGKIIDLYYNRYNISKTG